MCYRWLNICPVHKRPVTGGDLLLSSPPSCLFIWTWKMRDVIPKLKSSPSNSAGPTPTIMMERGSEAACVEKTNNQFVMFALAHEDKRSAESNNASVMRKLRKICGCLSRSYSPDVTGWWEGVRSNPPSETRSLERTTSGSPQKHRDFLQHIGPTLAGKDTASWSCKEG